MLLVDTREQKWDHVRADLDQLHVPFDRSKLYVGDYTFADNQKVCVDRKAGLQEVYGNLVGKQHARFVEECKRAQEAGIRLVVLIEQDDITCLEEVALWKNPRRVKWFKLHSILQNGGSIPYQIPKQPPISSAQLQQTMSTISDKYGVEWWFCSKEAVTKTILRILDPMKYGGI